jgi:murein DD-endopeptidase MepM/ murein hydrolase activator NlpD
MKRRRANRSSVVSVAAMGFLAGAMAMAFADRVGPHTRLSPISSGPSAVDVVLQADSTPAHTLRQNDGGRPVPQPLIMPLIEAGPADLRARHLELPVQGMLRGALRDSFAQKRGSTRSHEAIDILAPRNTAVLAVEDGVVARLFESKAGGTTVYQFDPSTTYAYYYAHLDRYADGLREGQRVQRGQVLGYVGTSGNAPRETPHLHFAIFRLTDKKQWWQGRPINPYDVLR